MISHNCSTQVMPPFWYEAVQLFGLKWSTLYIVSSPLHPSCRLHSSWALPFCIAYELGHYLPSLFAVTCYVFNLAVTSTVFCLHELQLQQYEQMQCDFYNILTLPLFMKLMLHTDNIWPTPTSEE
jgi:hypothetical protein